MADKYGQPKHYLLIKQIHKRLEIRNVTGARVQEIEKEHWVCNNLASMGLVSEQKLKFKTNFSENPT
jgi:hypothetical protein